MSIGFWLEWAHRFRWQLALISALTLLSSIATLAVPWLAAQLLSSVTQSRNPPELDLEPSGAVIH